MAALQLRSGSWRIIFRYKDKQYAYTIGEVSELEAITVKGKVEYLLMRLKQHLLDLPAGCDIVNFLQHDGKPPAEPPAPPTPLPTLADLREKYLKLHAEVLDPRTIADMRGHWKHLARLLREDTPADTLSLGTLQDYVLARVKEGVEGMTAKKEIVTLRTCWNWGARMGMVKGPFPNKGLRFPKGKEKPPFMTFAEVERRIAAGQPDTLWESVFLTRPEIDNLLAEVEKRAAFPWVVMMFWFAAHTGARRGEMLRVLREDIDLETGHAIIREKKRRRDVEESIRRVPLSAPLRKKLQQWLANHPGGPYLFTHARIVGRSKKRSKTTGHLGQGKRPTSKKARLATVRVREVMPPGQLSRTEASDHFKRTLAGTKWANLTGWHVLRHSFVSNCAAAGVDQRLIDAWVGHTTEEMRRRYRHLIPSVEQAAINRVFG
jgi:integrase